MTFQQKPPILFALETIINLNSNIMNIFMRKESLLVKKIERKTDGWNLYPLDKNQKPVFISNKNYVGKMPPFFKWPWQKAELLITRVGDFQISATLNDVTLFEIPEENYPEEIRKELERGEKLLAAAEAYEEAENNKIKKALTEYLPLLPPNPDWENDFSRFKICLRAYLKLHCFKGQPGPEHDQRVNLMAQLCQIAQRIYTRHINENEFFGTINGQLKYGFRIWGSVYPHYSMDVKSIEEAVNDKSKTDTTLEEYYEADKLLTETLPPIQNDLLRRYLNYVIRDVLSVFANDFSYFHCHLSKHGWSGKRLLTDEEEYTFQYKKMKMLKYTSFILPEQFSDQSIASFINNYNLK